MEEKKEKIIKDQSQKIADILNAKNLKPSIEAIFLITEFYTEKTIPQNQEKIEQKILDFFCEKKTEWETIEFVTKRKKQKQTKTKKKKQCQKTQIKKEEIFLNKILSLIPKNIDNIPEFQKTAENFYEQMTDYFLYKFQFFKKKTIEEISKFKNVKKNDIMALIMNIIPKEDLFCFLLIEEEEKVQHLDDLFHIIHGIELFKISNNNLSQENRFFSVCESVDGILRNLENLGFQAIEEEILFLGENEFEGDFGMEILVKSFFGFLLEIKQEVFELRNFVEVESNRFNSEIVELNLFIKNNPKIEKSKIYPFFKKISKIYLFIFLSYEKLLDVFELYQDIKKEDYLDFKNLKVLKKEVKETMQKSESTYSDHNYDFLKKNDYIHIKPNNWKNFINTELKYQGFDIITLLEKKKLKFSNLSLGIFKQKNKQKYISFETVQNCEKYTSQKSLTKKNLKKLLNEHPSLFFTLKKQKLDQFPFYNKIINHNSEPNKQKQKNQQIQTPTHFFEKSIDFQYFWNEWDLRKLAIKMVNIRNMKTTGSQTVTSLFKVDNKTQVWELKDKSTITGVENGNNPIWPKNYTVGLRFNEMVDKAC